MSETTGIPVGLQLFSVRKECKADLPGTLKRVAEMGYEGVEFAGWYDRTAAELRDMTAEVGLQIAGAHLSLDVFDADKFEETVEFHKTLGNKFLIVAGIPKEQHGSKQAWHKTAARLNKAADKLAPHGMRTGYHNHWAEFTEVDGELPWDIVFGNTKPEVIMQADAGNALRTGCRIEQFFEKYPGRSPTTHLKEYSSSAANPAVGEGEVRWDDFFRLCRKYGKPEWYVVEQNTKDEPALPCVERSLVNLRKMGG